MELITILVIIVSVLTFCSGLTVFAGARKGSRLKSLMFFLTAVMAALWAFLAIVFLNLPTGNINTTTEIIVLGVYAAPLVMMVMQVWYTGWGEKSGKILGAAYLVIAIGLMIWLAVDPQALYDSIILASAGNKVEINVGLFYIIYLGFVALLIISLVYFALHSVKTAGTKYLKRGYLFYATGLLLTALTSVIFNLVLPIWGIYNLTWIGPFTLSLAAILHFYAILRYKLLILSSTWLKIGSYVILMSVTAMAYMIIFSLIFSLLFKVKSLDTEVIVMNFIMIVIILLILPVFNEVNAFIHSLISVQQINMNYVIKKLNKMATQNVDLNELAEFLADSMHFNYIGLLVDGKLYGEKKVSLTKNEIVDVSMLKSAEHGIWQKIEGKIKPVLVEKEIVAVAELRNAKGRPFGQILVGTPLGKISFEKRDLGQIEMVVNLVASIIDSEKRLKV